MSDYRIALSDDSKYQKALNKIKPIPQRSNIAVVLHLYYAEKWPMINRKLKLLKEQAKYDLYISLKEDASDELIESIKLSYPEVCIIKVPNRGRDVLPFIYILSYISKLNYELILKIHSKKSLHRDDGADWFESILNDLIPDDPLLLKSIIDTFDDKEVSFVGPAEQYIPMTVNYGSNSFYLNKVMKKIFDNNIRHKIQKNPGKYGFFAGTMFWVRTSALKQFSRNIYKATDFRGEQGLIDATLAHAIERLLVVNAEIKKTKIYTIKYRSLIRTDYQTTNIPEWSDIHNSKRISNP
jgi:lipopolysaccharide biosynthesis protein